MSLDQYSFQDIVSLIGCYTNINTDDDKEYNGYLYTIDPQTSHVVLYDNHHLQVIFHSTIKTIHFDRQRQLASVELDNAVVKHDTTANLEQTCRELIKYFEMNRIPTEYKEPHIHLLGSARVEPPYVATSVVAENSLIRKRVRDLVMEFYLKKEEK
ncbi:hypothetical protein RMATCC62417_07032 [Rhizopus microsporus]|nr:hypothetical protein RMATCC62417_07032 [Rhizopus microsporus]